MRFSAQGINETIGPNTWTLLKTVDGWQIQRSNALFDDDEIRLFGFGFSVISLAHLDNVV